MPFGGAPEWPLDPALAGGRVQGVRQPDGDTVVLEIHRPGGAAEARGTTSWWLWSVNDEWARAGRVFQAPRRKGTQAVFCAWLRTRLVGARVERLLRPAPALLAMVLTREGEVCYLVLELNRRGSNLLLLDQRGCLLVALHHPARSGRSLAQGDPYVPPERFQGFARTVPFEARLPAPDETASREREAFWMEQEGTLRLDARKRPALQLARREAKKRRRRLEKLEQDAETAAEAAQWQRRGELLQIHRGRLRRGMTALEVPDVFQEQAPLVSLPLDPEAEPGENIERCFRRARKLRDGATHVARRLEETRSELMTWEAHAERIAEAASVRELEALAAALPSRERPLRTLLRGETTPTAPDQARAGVLRRFSRDGYEILVGRTDRDNDEVTFRLGRGRDWWFHVQGLSGSHVIVLNPADNALPPRTLHDAAWLAAYYSKGRSAGRVEVDYTQRKHVRKIKGGAPGQVTYAHNKTVLAELEDAEAGAVLERVEPV